MRNDQRERLDRRDTDTWARRIRALEREFARADKARYASATRAERQSMPLALFTGAVVIAVALLIMARTAGTSRTPAAPAAADPFLGTPAASWPPAAAGIAVPAAAPVGPFSAGEVRSALGSIRAEVVAAHTAPGVLAPGNVFAAPVRAHGAVAYRLGARSGTQAQRLMVTVNVVWAYALRADYRLAAGPASVVALHERSTFVITGPSDTRSVRAPAASTLLWFDADCGYRAQRLVGLPRAHDPRALLGYDNGVSADRAFNPATTIELSGHVCSG